MLCERIPVPAGAGGAGFAVPIPGIIERMPFVTFFRIPGDAGAGSTVPVSLTSDGLLASVGVSAAIVSGTGGEGAGLASANAMHV